MSLPDLDFNDPDFGSLYDELPLWSAPFGLLLLECVPLRGDLTILDVGAGTGFLTVELAQRCGPESRIIAVDPWKEAMSRLRWKLERLGLHNVTLLEQDAATIDLPDASVDVVVSNLGVNNFENADAVLRRCFRAAKPGATLLLTTNLVGHMAELYEVYRSTLIDLGRSERLPALDAHVSHRATVDSTTRLLQGAGFAVVETRTDAFHMRFADGTALLRHHFIRLGFLPAWRTVAGEGHEDATLAALERNLNARAARGGELSLTIPTALFHARRPDVVV